MDLRCNSWEFCGTFQAISTGSTALQLKKMPCAVLWYGVLHSRAADTMQPQTDE
jgi:hypothetical protein